MKLPQYKYNNRITISLAIVFVLQAILIILLNTVWAKPVTNNQLHIYFSKNTHGTVETNDSYKVEIIGNKGKVTYTKANQETPLIAKDIVLSQNEVDSIIDTLNKANIEKIENKQISAKCNSYFFINLAYAYKSESISGNYYSCTTSPNEYVITDSNLKGDYLALESKVIQMFPNVDELLASLETNYTLLEDVNKKLSLEYPEDWFLETNINNGTLYEMYAPVTNADIRPSIKIISNDLQQLLVNNKVNVFNEYLEKYKNGLTLKKEITIISSGWKLYGQNSVYEIIYKINNEGKTLVSSDMFLSTPKTVYRIMYLSPENNYSTYTDEKTHILSTFKAE